MTDLSLTSWVDMPAHSDFSIYNLPYGIFSSPTHSKRVGVAIGTQILDLAKVQSLGFLDEFNLSKGFFEAEFLNDFISLGKPVNSTIRQKITQLLSKDTPTLQAHASEVLVPQSDAQMYLPVKIGDYTDFYSSIEHATNVGTMFRDPDNALLPNWRHLPVGYHGRASSIVISGTEIHRPWGQTKADDAEMPTFQPCRLLDFELEMAFVVSKSTRLGQRITTAQAEEHIFGMVLFNDWSARDIQKWEYVPLGPFLAKSFASSISPWLVTLEALEPFRVASPPQEPEVLDYLKYEGLKNYDIQLEVALKPEKIEEKIISKSNFKYMYWNMCQQLAHHSVNGCNFNVGDMCASGTISGKDASSYGSMLEITWRGSKPITMPDGSERKFIQDNDILTLRGFAEKDGIRVGFGEVSGKILPALD